MSFSDFIINALYVYLRSCYVCNYVCFLETDIRGAIQKFRESANKISNDWVVFACRWGYELAFMIHWDQLVQVSTFQSRAASI